MGFLADSTPDMLAMPRFDDGAIDVQELIRRLPEQVVNAIMDAEADQLCGGGANSRNGYRERVLSTRVGSLTLRIPKLRTGSLFPDDVIERYQWVDRALVAAVAEMYATGAGTRKVQRIAEKMGVSRLSKDQVGVIAASLDADIDELCGRLLVGAPVPYVWLGATYVKCRREGRVASMAVVTAIGCDAGADAASSAWTRRARSPTTPGWRSCGRSGTEASRASSSSSPTPIPGSSARSARSSRAPRGSAAPCTSCATACARRGHGS